MPRKTPPAIIKAAIVLVSLLFVSGALFGQDVRPHYVSGLNLFIGLFNNFALLIIFAVGYGFLNSRLARFSVWKRQALLGLAFGVFALGCMQVRIPVAPGVIVDQRNAVVILAGAFGGPLCAAAAAVIAAGYRLYLGGSGIYGGVLGICLSATAGIVIGRLRRRGDSPLVLAASALASTLFIMPGFLPVGSWAEGWKLMLKMLVPYGSAVSLCVFSGALLLANEERRRKAKNELQASEKRYRELYESTIDMLHWSDKFGFMRIASPSCQALLGYKPEELVGKPANFFFIDPEGARAEMLKRIKATGSIDNFETEALKKDGTPIVISTNLRVILDEAGNFSGIMGVSRDVTQLKKADQERRRLEESLLQSRKMESVGSMAGGIAHDFNNILTAILGFSELLKVSIPAGDPAQQDVEGIVTAGLRAKELVNQILLFSRKSPEKKVPIRISLALRDAYSLIRASVPTTIEIRQEYGSADGSVLADSTSLHQVIMNLCTNAAQAMEEKGGLMTIELSKVELGKKDLSDNPEAAPGAYFAISISDTGTGIDPGSLRKIFDPYYTTKPAGKGTGLGLSVVDGIVKSHGGKVDVRSELGKGSTFTVFLPEIREAPTVAAPHESLPRGSERILLVDDESSIVYVTSRRLELLGYRVISFTDSLAALEAFKADPDGFDLVLTDKTMPSLAGPELARLVRKTRPGIPVILCSGYASPPDGRQDGESCIDLLLAKPIDYNGLATAIRGLLDSRK